MAQWPDQQLLRFITRERHSYTPAALALARAELTRRGRPVPPVPAGRQHTLLRCKRTIARQAARINRIDNVAVKLLLLGGVFIVALCGSAFAVIYQPRFTQIITQFIAWLSGLLWGWLIVSLFITLLLGWLSGSRKKRRSNHRRHTL